MTLACAITAVVDGGQGHIFTAGFFRGAAAFPADSGSTIALRSLGRPHRNCCCVSWSCVLTCCCAMMLHSARDDAFVACRNKQTGLVTWATSGGSAIANEWVTAMAYTAGQVVAVGRFQREMSWPGPR